jgi:hypothetical protein
MRRRAHGPRHGNHAGLRRSHAIGTARGAAGRVWVVWGGRGGGGWGSRGHNRELAPLERPSPPGAAACRRRSKCRSGTMSPAWPASRTMTRGSSSSTRCGQAQQPGAARAAPPPGCPGACLRAPLLGRCPARCHQPLLPARCSRHSRTHPAAPPHPPHPALPAQNAGDSAALTCNVKITLDKDMDGPVYVYYELRGMYQNHRRWVGGWVGG